MKPSSTVCPKEGETPQASNSDSSHHAVYKEIALANGHINRMSKEELRLKLSQLKLDTR